MSRIKVYNKKQCFKKVFKSSNDVNANEAPDSCAIVYWRIQVKGTNTWRTKIFNFRFIVELSESQEIPQVFHKIEVALKCVVNFKRRMDN